uniref:C-1-tetrahydrofolate synthase, cytoplasmic n=1 Tax=Mesocestoides corti TaxID=53468 RepID=A0A5K3FG77_MESCO
MIFFSRIISDIKSEILSLNEGCQFEPTLAVLQVGHREDSDIYLREQIRAAQRCGIRIKCFSFPCSVDAAEVINQIKMLNQNPDIHGIVTQFPLISTQGITAEEIANAIEPNKDVDGVSAAQVARLPNGDYLRSDDGSNFQTHIPCAAAACLLLLQETGLKLSGSRCLVVGRGRLIGVPIASLMLWSANATVTLCHEGTRCLEDEVTRAEIVITGVGKPGIVRGEWIRPGAAVIDCGMNTPPNGERKLVGDVNFEEAVDHAGWITPVPGGVGPVTVALLLRNTLNAAKKYHGLTTHPLLMTPTGVFSDQLGELRNSLAQSV